MARNNHSTALFLTILVLFSAANPLAHGHPGAEDFVVSGAVCCTPTGNCLGGRGLAGEEVRLNITNNRGGSFIAGRNTTDGNGNFYIYVKSPREVSANSLHATVGLPIANCPPLSKINGELVAPVRLIRKQIFPSSCLAVFIGLNFTVNN